MISVYEESKDCCGCTACKHICPTNAIEMMSDDEGFLYPRINQQLCIDCRQCLNVCAFQNGYDVSRNYKPPKVYAAKNLNEEIRASSTSGGVFTAISNFILANEGVIFGAAFDENLNVIHRIAKSPEERDLFKGAKYVQSDLNNVYMQIKQLLSEEVQVLFTGTPCQTAGLRKFLVNVNTNKLILCDVVCHGVPSPLVWRDHIKHLENKNKCKILGYNFRDKLIGWRGSNVTIKFEDKVYINNYLTRTYSNLYFSHLIMRPACHCCNYTNMERPSDITIADYWGIEKHIPEFDDNKGVSLVIVNTSVGLHLFESIKHELIIKESSENDCLQPQLIHPTIPSINRKDFWNSYYKYGYKYIIKAYGGYNLKNIGKITIKKIIDKLGLLNLIKKL